MSGDGEGSGPPLCLRPSGYVTREVDLPPAVRDDEHIDDPDSPSPSIQREQPKELQLFFADRPQLRDPRNLSVPESAQPLSHPTKRGGCTVVALARHPDVGTGQAYRSHVPLSAQIRINDTEGTPVSSLLDTGASLSTIDATLFRNLGGTPSGHPIRVNGIGATETEGWATITFFLAARDSHGREVLLECSHDFHILPNFLPGLCLGLDFIQHHAVSIDVRHDRALIGRYTFPVTEKLPAPYAKEAELCSSAAFHVPARSSAWIPIDSACLAPGVDYTIHPRCMHTADRRVQIAGPTAIRSHGLSHVLITNVGTQAINLPRRTPIADASVARLGETFVEAAHTFTLESPMPAGATMASMAAGDAWTAEGTEPTEEEGLDADVAAPLDLFEGTVDASHDLARDAATTLVDDQFKVGVDEVGVPPPAVVELLRRHRDAFALDGRPGLIRHFFTLIPSNNHLLARSIAFLNTDTFQLSVGGTRIDRYSRASPPPNTATFMFDDHVVAVDQITISFSNGEAYLTQQAEDGTTRINGHSLQKLDRIVLRDDDDLELGYYEPMEDDFYFDLNLRISHSSSPPVYSNRHTISRFTPSEVFIPASASLFGALRTSLSSMQTLSVQLETTRRRLDDAQQQLTELRTANARLLKTSDARSLVGAISTPPSDFAASMCTTPSNSPPAVSSARSYGRLVDDLRHHCPLSSSSLPASDSSPPSLPFSEAASTTSVLTSVLRKLCSVIRPTLTFIFDIHFLLAVAGVRSSSSTHQPEVVPAPFGGSVGYRFLLVMHGVLLGTDAISIVSTHFSIDFGTLQPKFVLPPYLVNDDAGPPFCSADIIQHLSEQVDFICRTAGGRHVHGHKPTQSDIINYGHGSEVEFGRSRPGPCWRSVDGSTRDATGFASACLQCGGCQVTSAALVSPASFSRHCNDASSSSLADGPVRDT
ncbi:hypothetical protein CF319_g2359 [Tilletia indica]|nr:hypothetical protein CF319_g2359 [Tilletia indica]